MAQEIVTADNGTEASTTALALPPQRSLAFAASDAVARMVVTVDDAVEMVHQRDLFMQRVMRPGLDYGVIPGTGTKPTLYKAGAERLLNAYGLSVEMDNDSAPVLDFTGADHGGEPYFAFHRICRVYKQLGPHPEDRILKGAASGLCNSWEVKYRYRQGQRLCPSCGQAAIIKGKAEYGGGFICFAKKGGCGEKFRENDPAIIEQETGRISNPDPADNLNTILKMAEKRALVSAIIIATGWSDIVTQDLEDFTGEDHGVEGARDVTATVKVLAPQTTPPPPPDSPEVARARDEMLAILRIMDGRPRLAWAQKHGYPQTTPRPTWGDWVASLDAVQVPELLVSLREAATPEPVASDAEIPFA